MVHGRMIRPAIAGAVPVKIDESLIKDIPGAKVVWDKGFLGVVADKEWGAIQAAQTLKVEWSQVDPPFPEQSSLYDHIRKASVRKRSVDKENGNVDDAFKTAAKIIEAEYEWPFQSHASMGPACALVEIKDGQVTCWSGTQKSHFVQEGLALTLDVPVDKVRVNYTRGPVRTAATTPMTAPWMRAYWPSPSASPCGCNICVNRALAGIRKVRHQFIKRAPRWMLAARSWPTSSRAKASHESM